MNYEPVIGLEVHVELNTKSKMFCRCSADYFGKPPNSHTCPVCLGLPGALPYINKQAIEDCMKIGLALNCSVSDRSLFERKNYFYPDLPKGYQISQYRWPLCVGGRLQVIGNEGQEVTIRINRAHQEEDTAKLTHQFGTQNSKLKTKNYSLIDFNRSGVPLVEIVTEPDFSDVTEVKDYAKKLQQLFRYLEVSNADMERGDMRLEANVSVRKVQSSKFKVQSQKHLPNYRVELKNINSFSFMVAAIEYEIKRQIEALEKGEKLSQETRGWNEDKKCTYIQRSKEEAHDYRYFPEPDLPEIRMESDEIGKIRKEIPELPWDKSKRFEEEFKLLATQSKILTEDRKTADYFEEAVKIGKEQEIDAVSVANYIINQKIDTLAVTPKQVIEKIASKSMGMIGDIGELNRLAEEAIKENPGMVGIYKKGKLNVIQAMIGSVMKKTGGKADADKVREILEEKLKK